MSSSSGAIIKSIRLCSEQSVGIGNVFHARQQPCFAFCILSRVPIRRREINLLWAFILLIYLAWEIHQIFKELSQNIISFLGHVKFTKRPRSINWTDQQRNHNVLPSSSVEMKKRNWINPVHEYCMLPHPPRPPQLQQQPSRLRPLCILWASVAAAALRGRTIILFAKLLN